jgi:formate hydrogenlyase transcriptional activator
VFPITVPPLRERAGDIEKLVRYFTQKYARRMNRPITNISQETMQALIHYSWPGNVRELENLIERAVILTRGATLQVPRPELAAAPEAAASSLTLEDAEREHIRRVLEQSNWVVGGANGAAARLGMKRTTLQSKMKKLGVVR